MNPRPPEPQSGALPTELHPPSLVQILNLFLGAVNERRPAGDAFSGGAAGLFGQREGIVAFADWASYAADGAGILASAKTAKSCFLGLTKHSQQRFKPNGSGV